MGFIDTILFPIKWVVAWVLVLFHDGLTAIGINAASGLNWVLSIVGLTLLMRIVLVPLFFRQIKAQRGMQALQPELMKLQAKYKGKTDSYSRQAMGQEQMALYKKHGTNPLSSCLPIIAQMPIFFSLIRVLLHLEDIAKGDRDPIGGLTAHLAHQAEGSSLFGASMSDSFLSTSQIHVKVLIAIMVLIMMATQFITQKQMMTKNTSQAAQSSQMMKQQKMMLYFFPLIFVFGGVSFPIGVLIYWVVSNLWTMGQQFYQLQRMPAPGSPAEKRLMEKRKEKGLPPVAGAKKLEADDEQTPPPARGQRAQPVRKDRAKPNSGSPASNSGSNKTSSGQSGSPQPKQQGGQPKQQGGQPKQQGGQPKQQGGQPKQPQQQKASSTGNKPRANSSNGQKQPTKTGSGGSVQSKTSQRKPAPANSGQNKKRQGKPAGAKRPSQSKPSGPRNKDGESA